MKKFIRGLLFTVAFVATAGMGSQIAHAQTLKLDEKNFPDKMLRESIEDSLWDNDDKAYEYDKKSKTYTIHTEYITVLNLDEVLNYKGLEKFTALKYLDICDNEAEEININFAKKLEELCLRRSDSSPKVNHTIAYNECTNLRTIGIYDDCVVNEVLDLSKMSKLEKLNLDQNGISTLILPEHSSLNDLLISSCKLQSLDLTGQKEITSLNIRCPMIKELDLSPLSKLFSLGYGCNGEKLDLSGCKKLELLTIGDYENNTELPLKEVNLSSCKKLVDFQGLNCPNLDNIDFSATDLYRMHTKNVALRNLDLSKCSRVKYVRIQNSELKKLDLSSAKLLYELDLRNNKNLKSIDVKKCPKLNYLSVERTGLTKLDVSKNKKLESLLVDGSKIKTLDLSKNNLSILSYYRSSVKKIKFNKKDKHLSIMVFCKDVNKKIDVSASVGKNGKLLKGADFKYNKKTGKLTQKPKYEQKGTIINNGRTFDIFICRSRDSFPEED